MTSKEIFEELELLWGAFKENHDRFSEKQVKAAGVRARHQLRAVRDKAGNLVNLSLENSKTQHPGASRHHFGNEIASLFNAEC